MLIHDRYTNNLGSLFKCSLEVNPLHFLDERTHTIVVVYLGTDEMCPDRREVSGYYRNTTELSVKIICFNCC